jgi:hypothetical protein
LASRPRAAAGGAAKQGKRFEDRSREQIYQLAKEKDLPGRSKMGKWDLIDAIRKAG